MMRQSLQETYAPDLRCFGCGPKNDKGLRIRSIVDGEFVVATWQAEPHHEAYPGMMNGGIVGTLLDCHCNWAAAWFLMQRRGLTTPPCTVTAEYTIKLLRPTPTDSPITMKAHVTNATDDRATVEATLSSAAGKVCATCTGLFVAVREGHPAFHRW